MTEVSRQCEVTAPITRPVVERKGTEKQYAARKHLKANGSNLTYAIISGASRRRPEARTKQ